MARISPENAKLIYEQAKRVRQPKEHDWKIAAAHCLPAHYSQWQTQGPFNPLSKSQSAVRRISFDSTGARSLPKYTSVLERLATPTGTLWHGLQPTDSSLRKIKAVQEYFDELRDLLFRYRYNPHAMFRVATNEVYSGMGVYGNGPIFIGKRNPSPTSPDHGIQYSALPMKDVFILTNRHNITTETFVRFWLNTRQFKMDYPNEKLPPSMRAEAEKPVPDETSYFEFVQHIRPRASDDFDPQAIDARRHPYVSSVLSVADPVYIGEEEGFRSLPVKNPRPMTVSGDPYGISPAIQALPALGTASIVKKTHLKQGNKAADPVLLAYDDGAVNGTVDQRPGAVVYGGIDAKGNQLIKPLQTGDFRVSEALLADERKDIEDSFFVTLFQILTENPEMTATEVVERVAEKAALLSPTMGRLQSEFLGTTIEREIDIFDEMGILPEMPPELIEAEGEYEVMYTSPMAKGMYAEEISGFMRAVEFAVGLSSAQGSPEPLDRFNFDVAIPEISDRLAVPARWMNDDDVVDKVRGDRADQQQQMELLQNAQGLANAAQTASNIEGEAAVDG